jgi:hypothetical protein
MANYLQNVIFSLSKNLGINIDPSSDPDTARVLSQIYNGNIPPAVSIAMYGYTLDAELGCAQVNFNAGVSSPVQASPLQTQALLIVNKAVENQLAASQNFSAQSALLLRRLKSDVISNTNIQSALSQYPIVSNTPSTSQPNPNLIPAASIDISPDVAAVVQTNITQIGQNYSSVYQILSQPDAIASDIGNAVGLLAAVSVQNLIQINSLLKMAQGGAITKGISGLAGGLSAFIFPQMLTQSSSILFQMDRIMQMAVTPVLTMSNPIASAVTSLLGASKGIGSLVGVVRSMTQAPSVQPSGPLAGMPLNNFSQSGLALSPAMPSGLASLGFSPGLNEISSLLQFSSASAAAANLLHQDAFQRLSARSTSDFAEMTKLLAVSSTITSLTSLISAFIAEQQSGIPIASQNPAEQLVTVGNILASAKTGNGTVYTVQGGSISLTPPTIPAPTAGASAILAQSGIQTSLTGLNS